MKNPFVLGWSVLIGCLMALCLTFAHAQAPWATALNPGQWYEIPNSAMSAVTPSPTPPGDPASKVIAWTSFAVDPRTSKVYSVAGGGHNDYAGNEVNVLNLEQSAPTWTQALPPTPTAQLTDCASYYADGRPTSRHSYTGVTMNVPDDRIMLIAGAPWCSSGGYHRATSSYNIKSNTYSPAAAHPDAPPGAGTSTTKVADPTTGDIYGFGEWQIAKWTRSSNTWTTYGINGLWGYGSMAAFDPKMQRILIVGGNNSEHHTFTPSTQTLAPITLTGLKNAVDTASGAAMVYELTLDRYLIRTAGAGAAVYQVHPTTFDVTAFATTGGTTIPATQNGPYNKFIYVPRLGGVVYVPTYTGNAWFLKTSGTLPDDPVSKPVPGWSDDRQLPLNTPEASAYNAELNRIMLTLHNGWDCAPSQSQPAPCQLALMATWRADLIAAGVAYFKIAPDWNAITAARAAIFSAANIP